MANTLLEKLRAGKNKHLFHSSAASVSYPTGFDTFDYRNGYIVDVVGEGEQYLGSYNSLGITGGTIIEVLGDSGTAKTSFCVQAAWNIIKDFDSGIFMHFDAEKSTTLTRAKNLTKSSREEFESKYILNRTDCFVEDIMAAISDLANSKRENKDDFTYDTGLMDDFGNPIKMLVPSVILIDSLIMLGSKDGKNDEIEGLTAGSRKAILLNQFITKMTPIIQSANILVMLINHVTDKPKMSMFDSDKPQLMYMKRGKSVSGGIKQLYLANNVLWFEQCQKYNVADNGFDGFQVLCQFWKTRQNKANQSCKIVFEQQTGFNNVMSLFEFAKENGLITGRNPKSKLVGDPTEFPFDTRRIWDYQDNEDLLKAVREACKPLLEDLLSRTTRADLEKEIKENNSIDE